MKNRFFPIICSFGLIFSFHIAAFSQTEKEITLEEILAAPADVDLNYEYAKQQIQRGDFLGAVSTLERLLLIDPNRAKVRLLYAVVLFRLDNLHEAETELRALREIKMPSSVRREVDGYLQEIKLRERRTRLGLRQSVGFQYDWNRNASPSSKERLVADVRTAVPRQSGRRSDTSFLNITTIDLAQNLGFQAGHEVFGSFTYYLSEQTEHDALDLSAYLQEYGMTLKSEWLNITPSVLIGNVLVSRETFLRSRGGKLLLDRNFNKLNLFAEGNLVRQEFVDISENLQSHERKGNRVDGSLGLRYAFFDNLRTSFQYTRVEKRAEKEYHAYNSNSFTTSVTALPGKGQFLTLVLDFGFDRYQAPDLAVATRYRRDRHIDFRLTYGAPLSYFFMGKLLPAILGNTIATITYEYDRAFSNVTNYTYRNNKVQTMLTQRWEF